MYKTPKNPNSNASKKRIEYAQKGGQQMYEERFIFRALKAGFTVSQARSLLKEYFKNKFHG